MAAEWNALFSGLVLKKDCTAPAYFQIKTYIEKLITTDALKPGDRLPSERDFCAAFPVSRMTYRQALTTLSQQGLLVQQQGRGTFVAERKVGLKTMDILSFSEALHGQGLDAGARTLKKRLLKPAPPELAQELGINPKDGVIALVRVRLVEDVPFVVESSWLSAARFGELLGVDLYNRSLYAVLQAQFDTVITRRREIIEAVAADEKLVRLLNVEPGSPLVRSTGYNYGADGMPVEFAISYYRGDRARFTFETKM